VLVVSLQKNLDSYYRTGDEQKKGELIISNENYIKIKKLVKTLREPTDAEKELILKFLSQGKNNQYVNRWLHSSDRDRILEILKLLNWL